MPDTALCRSCLAEIIWARTEAGKLMCLDATPRADGNFVLNDDGTCRSAKTHLLESRSVDPDRPRYMTHWATCPSRDQHRKQK